MSPIDDIAAVIDALEHGEVPGHDRWVIVHPWCSRVLRVLYTRNGRWGRMSMRNRIKKLRREVTEPIGLNQGFARGPVTLGMDFASAPDQTVVWDPVAGKDDWRKGIIG